MSYAPRILAGPAPLLMVLGLWAGAAQAQPAAPGGEAPRRVEASMGDDQPQAAPPADVAAFEAALRSERTAQTAQALLELGRRAAATDLAPEALFEAAQIYEERLGMPQRARDLYDEVATRYPQSRLSRRAQYRRDELTQGLRSGEAPLREFRDILNTYHQAGAQARGDRPAGPAQAARRLEALLAAHPDFALADQARYLLGSAYRESGQPALAQAALLQVLQRHPSSTFAPRAEQALAELALQRHDFAAARRRFAGLPRYGGSLWSIAAAEGLEQVQRAQRRYWLAVASLLCVTGLGVLWALRARRRLWPPPAELWYYAPVASFLCLVGQLTSGGSMGRPLLGLSAGGVVLTWLAGASARLPRARPVAVLGLVALRGLLGRLLAVLALCYLVLHYGQLTDLVLDTIRNGPER